MKLFSMDGKFLTFFNRVTDLIVLNLLWLLMCLPIFTIGASTAALYRVTLQMAENKESYIAKSFFCAFRENFRQATVVWIAFLLSGLLLLADIFVISHFFAAAAVPFTILFFIILLLWAGCLLYVFPVIAYFKNSLKKVFINSFRLAFGNLILTLQLFLLALLPFVIPALFHSMPILGSFLLVIIVPAATAFFQSVLLSRVFGKLSVTVH